MRSSLFADRLGELLPLTEGERSVLAAFEERERVLRRGTTVVRENEPAPDLFILKRGIMMSCLLLADGSRQILRFFFPGDLLAMSALTYKASPESIQAVTDAAVAPFEKAAMARMIAEHPRLAAMCMVLNQMERVALTDRLAGLGRTSAKARIAATLIDVRDRLRISDPTVDGSFPLPLTQEEIGDAAGLTAVHVNRMLRQLEEEQLIARGNGRVTFLNEPRLKRAANYVDRFANLDLSWLPPARES